MNKSVEVITRVLNYFEQPSYNKEWSGMLANLVICLHCRKA